MVDVLQTTEGTLTAASAYLLIGLGWNVVYSACGYLNLTLPQFYVLGAVAGIELNELGITSVAMRCVLVVLAVGLIALGCERLLVRPLGEYGLNPLIVTVGISLVLLQVVRELAPQDVVQPPDFIGGAPLDVGGVMIARQEIIVWLTAAVLATAVLVFFRHTDTGRTMRACADDRGGAEALGINAAFYGTVAFSASAMLAAVAALVVTPIQGASTSLGDVIAIKALMAVWIVGLGRNGAAVVGALVVAAAEGYIARYWSADVRDIVVLAGFLAVLYIRTTPDMGIRRPLFRRRLAPWMEAR